MYCNASDDMIKGMQTPGILCEGNSDAQVGPFWEKAIAGSPKHKLFFCGLMYRTIAYKEKPNFDSGPVRSQRALRRGALKGRLQKIDLLRDEHEEPLMIQALDELEQRNKQIRLNRNLTFIYDGNPLPHRAHCHKAQWLMTHKDFDGDQCLLFPHQHPGFVEYVRYNYRRTAAARAMLTMTQGLPPKKGMMAIHACGNGHLSCVNPKHLRWGTAKDNAQDRCLHDNPREFIAGMKRETIEAIRAENKLFKVLAYEYQIPASVVAGIKSGELYPTK